MTIEGLQYDDESDTRHKKAMKSIHYRIVNNFITNIYGLNAFKKKISMYF